MAFSLASVHLPIDASSVGSFCFACPGMLGQDQDIGNEKDAYS